MTSLEAAQRRLDTALDRLEAATARLGQGDAPNAERARLEQALSAAERERCALLDRNAQVSRRLDAAIRRLNALLGE